MHNGTKVWPVVLLIRGIEYICRNLSIMVILNKTITREELVRLAENFYGDMIKGVVDVENEEIRERIRTIVNKYMA